MSSYYRVRNVNVMIEMAKRDNERVILYKEFYLAALKVLEKFDGKVATRRILSAMLKDPFLSRFAMKYDCSVRMTRIVFWGNGLEYDQRSSVFICYHSDPVVNMEKVRDWNHGFEIMKLIDISTVEERVNKWNKLVSDLDMFIEGEDISYLLRS